MKHKNGFFIAILSIIMVVCFVDTANAAARAPVRATPAARKSVTTNVAPTVQTQSVEPETEIKTETVVETKPEFVITNKSSDFDLAVTTVLESAADDNSFAEMIRKQRAALSATESTNAANEAQKKAMATNSNTCDSDLRKCMTEKCGNDFTKCALDGDTIFGDKLNSCKTKTTCTATEFNLFVPEIRADRDMNVRLASYNNVIDCGNQYNACIVNECGTTYNKCLGKANADAAIQKCATIAKECTESDSGLANRFGTAIAKLRESAEKEIKVDEDRMYKLRDSMSAACKKLGAMFDERTFDCVYTINFFAGENQSTPTTSRKRYAGDTFICMQEWFGINATTFKENAFRETRSQTAASSAMLGSGVGMGVGLITSGAIDRAVETQKAKKAVDEERILQDKPTLKEEEQARKDEIKKKKDERKADKKKTKEEEEAQAKAECEANSGAKYTPGVCWCPGGQVYKKSSKTCEKIIKTK